MVKAPEPDRIPIASPAQLDHELTLLQSALTQPETEHTWENIDRAVKRFQAVVRGGAYKFTDEFIRRFRDKAISNGIIRSLATERTRLSASTLDLIASCTRLHAHFQPLLTTYLSPLLRLLCRTNKLYISRALATLHGIIKHTLLVDILKFIVIEWKLESGKSSSFRIAVAEAISTMLGAGTAELVVPKEAFDKRVEELEWVIRIGATDREPKVRGEIKKCWNVYKREWPERVAQFTAPMTPISRKYLNVAAVGGPSTSHALGPKPRAPSGLSSSVSASSGPKKTTTAPHRSAFNHRPIPSTSSHPPSTSSAPPPTYSSSSQPTSSRPTPLSASLYGGRPMPAGPLTSTTARDMRLAKSVGHGLPPPVFSSNIEETARSGSGGSLPSATSSSAPMWTASDYTMTGRTPHGPPIDAPIPSTSSSSSSSSTPHVPPSTSGGFKPSTNSRSFRLNSASATQASNVEVRRARRVAPVIAPPPVMANVAPIGRPATLARHGAAASNGPFRPKASRAPSALSTVVKPIEKRTVVSSSVVVPRTKTELEPAVVPTKSAEEVQELERLVKIVDAGGVVTEDSIVDDEVLRSHLLDGLVETTAAQAEVDSVPEQAAHAPEAAADVAMASTEVPDAELPAVATDVAPMNPKVEAQAVSSPEDPGPVLCGSTTLVCVEPDDSTEKTMYEHVVAAVVETSLERTTATPETTEEQPIEEEPIPTVVVAPESTPVAAELETCYEIKEPGEWVEEPTCDAIRIVDLQEDDEEDEASEDLAAVAGGAKESVETVDEVDGHASSAGEDTVAELPAEDDLAELGPEDVEEKVEQDDTCDFDEHASTVEIEPTLDDVAGIEGDAPALAVDGQPFEEEEEIEEAAAETEDEFEEELDNDGPTFDLPPTTPAQFTRFTPEPFAQTCSIMLDTPPRFEDFVSMAIRVPGALGMRMNELAQQAVVVGDGELNEGPEDIFNEHAQDEVYEDEAEDEKEAELPERLVSQPLSPSVRRVLLEKPHAMFEDEQSFSVDLSVEVDMARMEEQDDDVEVEQDDHDGELEVSNSAPTRYTYEHAPASVRSALTHDDSSDDEDVDACYAHARRSSASPCDPQRSEGPVRTEEEIGEEQEQEQEEVLSPVIFSRSLRSRVVEVLEVKAVASPVKTRRGGRREVLGELR
ncbi:BQ2448_7398 [Microbotryum intermedium]|uniref:BQ2448_7398 protein n=2 Tax=Microbotryum intermedium TaxID=269621 RepID=A0A238FI52_9BASI|nr:BQ2448_7398 [Microbotryum intermedium]